MSTPLASWNHDDGPEKMCRLPQATLPKEPWSHGAVVQILARQV